MNAKNKNYTIEVTEEEAERLDQAAKTQGVSTPDYLLYWIRHLCFGMNYAVRRLAETGQVGKREKE
jgi:hypothetical protein